MSRLDCVLALQYPRTVLHKRFDAFEQICRDNNDPQTLLCYYFGCVNPVLIFILYIKGYYLTFSMIKIWQMASVNHQSSTFGFDEKLINFPIIDDSY